MGDGEAAEGDLTERSKDGETGGDGEAPGSEGQQEGEQAEKSEILITMQYMYFPHFFWQLLIQQIVILGHEWNISTYTSAYDDFFLSIALLYYFDFTKFVAHICMDIFWCIISKSS